MTDITTELQTGKVVERIWRGDHTLWKPDPTEITEPNRLGWLTIVDQMLASVDDLQAFAAQVRSDGLKTAVLLGMGGSSLAPEVLFSTFGAQMGGLELKVLDSTVPEDIAAVDAGIDPATTLFIVSSKSGGTIEPNSLFAHYWQIVPDGSHFIAITDPGTSLEKLAKEHGFRRAFLNNPDMGGRYSALSYFGMVPAALIGVDLPALLGKAHEMQKACGSVSVAENPGASLGALLGEASLAGRDKVTLILPGEIAALSDWIEQLLAESTGKEDKGIIPIAGEPLGKPESYGSDRIFVAIGDSPELAAIQAAGHQVVRLPFAGRDYLGADFLQWEFATAVAGHILAINPFDQPNVEEAKAAATRFLTGSQPAPPTGTVADLLAKIGPGDYAAVLAYLPRSHDNRRRIQAVRVRLRDRYKVATTTGFGPRYLHSTGQIHKGGPNSGVFIQLVDEVRSDIPIPGKPYSFARLNRAQADGDLEALLSLGRRAVRTTLANLEEALK